MHPLSWQIGHEAGGEDGTSLGPSRLWDYLHFSSVLLQQGSVAELTARGPGGIVRPHTLGGYTARVPESRPEATVRGPNWRDERRLVAIAPREALCCRRDRPGQASISSRYRMMFVHDAPPAVALAKTHGEAELKLNSLAIALPAAAAPDRGSKGHIRSSR